MGKVIRTSRWHKAEGYMGRPRKRTARWFPLALVALPLGAFSAVFFAPAIGEGPQAAALAPPGSVERGPPSAKGSTPAELEAEQPALAAALPSSRNAAAPGQATEREAAFFPLCSGPLRETCVVDGDTIWYRGEKIRLVGFDTPEVSNPGCPREAALGAAATRRLQDWLNAGAFTLSPNPEGRPRDRYDRALLVASRGGENVGEVLLAEGLAERRGGGGNVWC